MKYELLDRINSPEDLRVIPKSDLEQLASEIRNFLVEVTSQNGGHLASNLGVVEITLAIHRTFNSPRDNIIFDVGHQSYVHKIITGRRERFTSLRKPGGLSGFPSIKESEYDAFGTGHSSTSISAAIGLATADKLQCKDSYTVCVIGDGAFTGGMVHEALNNVSPDLPLIIILNENGMAISKNRGNFADYISKQTSTQKYYTLKSNVKSFINSIPFVGRFLSKSISKVKKAVKNIFYSESYFEKMGFEYFGPVDGHDIEQLEELMKLAKKIKKPVIIHTKTTKGKGFDAAEDNPQDFHSVQKNDVENNFSSVFTEELISIAKENKAICAITPAMAKGTGLYKFGEEFPDRYFDTGIAEAHALTFGAALAKSKMKPFVATYSTFLQRGYDNLIHDISLQQLPVKIISDRAGLAVNDGPTHHGIFDVSYLSSIPNMTIFAPVSYKSLREFVRIATIADSPVAIRYASSNESEFAKTEFFSVAKAVDFGVYTNFDINIPPEYVFVTYGKILDNVIVAESYLKKKGLSVGIILVEIIKPYDNVANLIMKLSSKTNKILYVEEGMENGGAAVLTMNAIRKRGFDFKNTKYSILAIDDDFVVPTGVCDIYDFAGLSPRKIVEKMIL